MKRLLLFSFVLCLVPPSVQAQALADDPRVQQALNLLDVWMDAERAYKQIPGISLALVHDQEVLWRKGFGVANRESSAPATPETIYSICSISKLFTSLGVMQLRDAGELRLDDPVGKHLPWFTLEQAYPEGPAVTVQGLLTHSAGLPRESDYPYWTNPDFPFPTREQVVARVSEQQTLYPADTYFQYSNLGLTLAGELVSELSGRPFDEYMQARILDPLGLEATRTYLPEELHGSRLATGYGAMQRDGTRRPMPLFQARGIAPAAGFSSTVEDLSAFAAWQFRLLENGGEEVLKANTLREMYRVHWMDPDWETAWGLGFATWRAGDKTFVGHGGSCPGYRSSLILQPDNKIAVVVMANASGVNAGGYASTAYKIIAPAIGEAKASPGEGKASDPAFEQFVGTYDSQPWAGEMTVFPWKDGLGVLWLPTDDPLDDLTRLKHIEGNRFRRVRDNDELGEEVVFEMNDTGQVQHARWHSNLYRRVDNARAGSY